MNVQFFSDLHLEFFNEYKLNGILNSLTPISDVLFLGGDIGNVIKNNNLSIFFKTLATKFNKIFYVCGNHEYYDYSNKNKKLFNSFDEWESYVHIETKKIIYENIIFFDNTNSLSAEYLNLNIFASTLWSKLDVNYKDKITKGLNDFHLIPGMTFETYLDKFTFQHNNLSKQIKENMESSSKNVVLTHHLPVTNLVFKDYDYELKSAYGTNLNELMIYCYKWFAGHTHKKINNIEKLITNPVGYKGENFDQNKIINSVFSI